LARKNGAVIHHTDLAAMAQIDGVSTPEVTVSIQEWEAAGGLARIIGGQIVLGKTPEEQAAESQREALLLEEAGLKRDLAAGDYKVIKAAEAGQPLEEVYPGLHAQRQQARDRINEIEASLAQIESGQAVQPGDML